MVFLTVAGRCLPDPLPDPSIGPILAPRAAVG